MKKRMIQAAAVAGMAAFLIFMSGNAQEAGTEEETVSYIEEGTEENSEENTDIDSMKSLNFEVNGYIFSTVANDNVNNFGETSYVTYETNFGNEIKSGTICVEEWYQGACVKSFPGILAQDVEEIFIRMSVSMDGASYVTIVTDEYDGGWSVSFPFPEGVTVSDRYFTAYEEGYGTELKPGEERILSLVALDIGNGVEEMDCDTLVREPQKLEEADYVLVVRASFEEEDYELQEKSPNGSYPTNLFRLDEVIALEDENRNKAYISALENILYQKIPPLADEESEWIEGVNSFALFDVNFDGKEELLIKHDHIMADTALYIYEYDEEAESLRRIFYAYPALTFYDNGIIIAEASHNQTGNEFWPYTLWQLDKETGTYEKVVSVDNEKKDAEVRAQYIGDSEIMEILLEKLPSTMQEGAG